VRHIARDVLVLYLGRTAEYAPKTSLFARPRHPYTRMLLAATPSVEGRHIVREKVQGEMPSPLNPPPGCAFSTRCSHARDRCRAERPALRPVDGHMVACHFAEEIV
jgi:dipeptide transport system ATP-binding protein